MGENSIINISESRADNDWKSERLSCDVRDIRGGEPSREIARFASGDKCQEKDPRRPLPSGSLSTIHQHRVSRHSFPRRARFLVALVIAVLLMRPTMAIPALDHPPFDRPIRAHHPDHPDSRFLHFSPSDNDDEANGFPASLVPPQSGMRSQRLLHEPELDTIRRSIVEGLGLERIPDPSKANVSQTEYRRAHVEYLTRLQHSRDNDDTRLRKLHTFHPAERSRSPLTNRSEEEEKEATAGGVLHFPIGSIPLEQAETEIDHASLRFLLDARRTRIDPSRHAISVYRLVAPDTRVFVSRRRLTSSEERDTRWIEIDATEMTLEHYRQRDPGDLRVELVFESFENENGKYSDNEPSLSHAAFNVFTTTSWRNLQESSGRVKRRANPPERLMSLHKGRRTECRGENKKCCRHEMTVTFKDLKGFEFIVQPKNFDAGFCKGRCPPRYNPAHHHALLQSLIWKEDRRKAPRPCCAPSKLDELEILYFDENDPTKLKISTWKNMRVLECACS